MDIATSMANRASSSGAEAWTVARLVGTPNTTTNRATISIYGSEKVTVPFVPGSYSGVTWVYVQLCPVNGPLVLGPCFSDPAAPAPPPDAPAAGTPSTETATTLIQPIYTGSYRTGFGWDRWNAGRYGGPSTVWQGDQYGSGVMLGFAGYGTQVRDLGAVAISRIRVSTPLLRYSGSIVLQGSASGTKPGGAPSSSGATGSGVNTVDLPSSVCEAFRTGAARGLVAVGSAYRATKGSASANGMSLSVTYTRPA